jgi:hypothetical protein
MPLFSSTVGGQDCTSTQPVPVVHQKAWQALAFVYCEDEPGRRTTGKLLTRDEARRIAANIAKLPKLVRTRPPGLD